MASQSVFLGTRPATRAPVLPIGRGAHGGCPIVWHLSRTAVVVMSDNRIMLDHTTVRTGVMHNL